VRKKGDKSYKVKIIPAEFSADVTQVIYIIFGKSTKSWL
jgi:hypothetical protein